MINLEFLGTGDAFDSLRGNSSILVHSETKILIDAGNLTPYFFAKAAYNSEYLDAIYISHLHPDHCFGLLPLLVHFAFDGRKKPLSIISKPGIKEFISNLEKMSYSELKNFAKYKIDFIETTKKTSLNEFTLEFAPTIHPSDPYSIKLTTADTKIAFSSDGKFTDKQKELLKDCNLIVFNTEKIEEEHPVHCNIKDVLNYTKDLQQLKQLVLLHIDRKISRAEIKSYLSKNFPAKIKTFIPEPLDQIRVE